MGTIHDEKSQGQEQRELQRAAPIDKVVINNLQILINDITSEGRTDTAKQVQSPQNRDDFCSQLDSQRELNRAEMRFITKQHSDLMTSARKKVRAQVSSKRNSDLPIDANEDSVQNQNSHLLKVNQLLYSSQSGSYQKHTIDLDYQSYQDQNIKDINAIVQEVQFMQNYNNKNSRKSPSLLEKKRQQESQERFRNSQKWQKLEVQGQRYYEPLQQTKMDFSISKQAQSNEKKTGKDAVTNRVMARNGLNYSLSKGHIN